MENKAEDQKNQAQIIHIAARELAETVYRRGGLSPLNYRSLSAREGTRTHQAFAAGLRDQYLQFEVEHELSLKKTWPADYGFTLPSGSEKYIAGIEISGRADVLLRPQRDPRIKSFAHLEEEPDQPFIIEVKTTASDLGRLPEGGEDVHWQQARLYTWLYWSLAAEKGEKLPEEAFFALAYVSAETLEARFFFKSESFASLKEWFIKTCDVYLARAAAEASRIEARNRSIRELRFPYETLREGQGELIRMTFEMIRRRTPLIAQAPTGTGKTMSVLYPAVKELLNPDFSHIFYLTAKQSTRRVAEQALDDMRKASALRIRQITLAAKESLCLAPHLYCDTTLCPFAVSYYDHLPAALKALRPLDVLNAGIISDAAARYRVCPFELSLDLALHCDVIIGDYNHAFDPRVQLERFFAEGSGNQILLLDEAHNLVDRSRDMYSCTLESKDFNYFAAVFKDQGRAAQVNNDVLDYFKRLGEGIKAGEAAWDQLEEASEGEMRIMAQGTFRATREPLKAFAERLRPWLRIMREQIDGFEDPRQRRKMVELIGQVKFFLQITEEFWSEVYIACARLSRRGTALRLICLDVSEKLSQTYLNRHAAVFFSATLSPVSYFSMNFCGSNRDNRPETLRLPSPFPRENLQVIAADFISTLYRNREATAASLAKALALAVLLKKGQQLIYFPSFAYMELIMPLLQKILSGRNIHWQIQSRRMNLQAREQFLKAFDRPEEGKTLIGVAVLGGIFAEGIDLVGDKLSGVSIVGVGLPQISPERNIMREYYDAAYHGGFQYAYLYPGMNKVLQAAGRLIRSEEDKGFLLLIDERYKRPSYRGLLPEEWIIEEAGNLRELKDLLEAGQNP
mgnify:CR=1 FL=1